MLCSLYTKNNIIQYAKALYKFKVLMNHSDTKVIGIIWIVYLYLNTILLDNTFLCLV